MIGTLVSVRMIFTDAATQERKIIDLRGRVTATQHHPDMKDLIRGLFEIETVANKEIIDMRVHLAVEE
jgi:hypothetical protein